MSLPFQHIYRPSTGNDGMLYAWFPAMHTRVDLLFYGPQPEAGLLSVVSRITALLHVLEQTGNAYDPTSELAAANRCAFAAPVVLSDELYVLLSRCLDYHTRTLGCFDISVHSDNYTSATLSDVHLCAETRTLRFARPGIVLNLSGFLKGYALDLIRELLRQEGILHALVNMGNSSVLALGNHPAGDGWKVNGIQLCNECLTTSGNDTPARRHIVAPHSGAFVGGVRQIAVVTPDGATGEVLSTALFAADEWRRKALFDAFPQLNGRCYDMPL